MIRPLSVAVAACCAEVSGTKAPRIARQAKSSRIFLQIKIISPHITSRVKAGILVSSERRTRCEVFETLISVKAAVAATGSRTRFRVVSPVSGSSMRLKVRQLCNKLGRNTGPLNQRTRDWESDD